MIGREKNLVPLRDGGGSKKTAAQGKTSAAKKPAAIVKPATAAKSAENNTANKLQSVAVTDSGTGGSGAKTPEKISAIDRLFTQAAATLKEKPGQAALQKEAAAQTPQQTAKTGASSAGSAAQQTAPAVTAPTFESLFADMLSRYLPETVSYTPLNTEEIKSMLVEWLRPAYEQAIHRRREQTDRANAELDADAWARGMGSSTFVTDVKDRAFAREARDVDDLESDYASTLAGHLYDALKSGQEQKFAIDRFNAEQTNEARKAALDAAMTLYRVYQDAAAEEAALAVRNAKSSGKSTVSAAQKSAEEAAETYRTQANAAARQQVKQAKSTVDLRMATNLIARMTPEQRAALYAGSDSAAAQQRREIIDGIGYSAYSALRQQYPA